MQKSLKYIYELIEIFKQTLLVANLSAKCGGSEDQEQFQHHHLALRLPPAVPRLPVLHLISSAEKIALLLGYVGTV